MRGELVHVHRKVHLPTYGLFEEGRYFAAGDSVRSFPTRFGRLAMLVCEDVWHLPMPYLAALDGALNLAGVVLNRVGTARQERVIRDAIRRSCGLPVLGAVPRLQRGLLPSRIWGC